MAPTDQVPVSILIVGSGVFGLSTAYALTQDPDYQNTEIYLVDKWQFETSQSGDPSANPTASSTDTSRIVRFDYTKGPYADLGVKALEKWRGDWGADKRFSQSGYILIARDGDTERLSTGGYNHVTLAYVNAIRAAGGNSNIELLDSEADIERASGYPITATGERASTPSSSSIPQSKGYINRNSGWADAAASVQYLRAKVTATKRVKVICGTAQKLLYSSPVESSQQSSPRRKVDGILLASGEKIFASQIILAAGPHTPGLTDLRAACEARGQVICYLKLTPAELVQFPTGGNPCMMDASSGLFVVGPDREGYIKITRDSKGYRNPVRVTLASDGRPELPGLDNAKRTAEEEKEIETSLPWDGPLTTDIPPDGEADCRAFLRRLFPPGSSLHEIASRPFERTRTCWYSDTRTSHFIIAYHPRYAKGSLFIATGGSGHAFKFLPVLGEKIVQLLKCGPDDGLPDHAEADIATYKALWKFPETKGENDDGIVFCQDGSRHGREDMIFEERMKAQRTAAYL
ncbi:MAG: hypothetical protein LQ342_005274 [Letrouitia transgressa]|nr:MAG: hypothetical protein LQ342_005274 [Letrouitia transgressa]